MFAVIIFSISCYCLETVPVLRDWSGWYIIEAVTSNIFAAELILRFIVTGLKVQFIIHPLNIIDFCSILPFYIKLILIGMDISSLAGLRVLRIFRLMRVIRVSKFIKPYIGIFWEMLLLSRYSLPMLAGYTFFCTIVLSALIYSAEEKHGTFQSIFEAMYWCVVTQTTLGYGDIAIVTVLGRFIACITAYLGIIQLTMTINVLGSCFDEAYTRFLSTKERDFKKQLGIQIQESRRASLANGLPLTLVPTSNSSMIKMRSPSISHDINNTCGARQLLRMVAKLTSSLADLETENSISSCKHSMALIREIKDLMEGIINSDKLSDDQTVVTST